MARKRYFNGYRRSFRRAYRRVRYYRPNRKKTILGLPVALVVFGAAFFLFKDKIFSFFNLSKTA